MKIMITPDTSSHGSSTELEHSQAQLSKSVGNNPQKPLTPTSFFYQEKAINRQ